MATNYGNVTATNTAAQLIASNPGRRSLVIYNNGSVAVYIGPDASITTANAVPILPQSSFTQNGSRMWMGAIYGITASSTADTRFWDYGE